MKRCGFDGILIQGALKEPGYLLIENENVSIKEASNLWGNDTEKTLKQLKKIEGNRINSLMIGPAGENQINIASIMNDATRAFGRGGVGAVMGSKNLKAIVVKGGERKIEIDDKDIRIDTFRSSGKGGQHLNKTDSAVRITHLPSGVIVSCQNERSQHKNKATALKILKSKLRQLEEIKREKEKQKIYEAKGEIGWGYQIRSYVFMPYQLVKDLRTGYEVGNVQAVLDGEIDGFIQSYLEKYS